MTRVRVIVEGLTEESFVAGPLYRALAPYGVFLQPTILGLPGHKGGNVKYARVRSDIVRTLKQDRTTYCTTLFDFYGLGEGFPIPNSTVGSSGSTAVERLENAVLVDITQEIPEYRPDIRLLPYFQLYEFEALLFSDPTALAAAMFREDLAAKLLGIRSEVATPEDINDGPETAPSKRILSLNRSYSKVISGTLAAEHMGIDVIKKHCPRFRMWFQKLLALGEP